MADILIRVLVCFIAGAGAGIGTGFAGMSAAAVIGPMLITFLGIPAYDAVGIGLISDVLASLVSAYTYKKSGNLDIKNSLPLLIFTTKPHSVSRPLEIPEVFRSTRMVFAFTSTPRTLT